MSSGVEHIVRNELIGLDTHVLKSRDPTHVSLRGTVIGESKEMLVLQYAGNTVRLPKTVCVFEFTTPDGSTVRVDGSLLRSRPEERLKKRLNRRW